MKRIYRRNLDVLCRFGVWYFKDRDEKEVHLKQYKIVPLIYINKI